MYRHFFFHFKYSPSLSQQQSLYSTDHVVLNWHFWGHVLHNITPDNHQNHVYTFVISFTCSCQLYPPRVDIVSNVLWGWAGAECCWSIKDGKHAQFTEVALPVPCTCACILSVFQTKLADRREATVFEILFHWGKRACYQMWADL